MKAEFQRFIPKLLAFFAQCDFDIGGDRCLAVAIHRSGAIQRLALADFLGGKAGAQRAGDNVLLFHIMLLSATGSGAGGGFAADVEKFLHADPVIMQLGPDERVDAVVPRLFLHPGDFHILGIALADFFQAGGVERINLFQADHRHIGDIFRPAVLEQVVINLTGADQDAADFGLVDRIGFVDPVLEAGLRGKLIERADAQFVAQHALGAHDDQRATPRPVRLPAEHVEQLGRRGGVADLHVVFGTELQEAFEAGVTVFRALAFVAVRKEHHQAAVFAPFAFAGAQKLIDDRLGHVDEVTELGFPDDQSGRVGAGEAIFKTEDRKLRQGRVHHDDAALVLRKFGKWHVRLAGLVIKPDGVAMRERTTADVLTGEANPGAFVEQRAQGQHFAAAPVDALFFGHRLDPLLHHPRHGPCGC